VGGFVVGSAWIEFFGTSNEQKRLESRDPPGLPQRLAHETFGWSEQDTEIGYGLSYVGGFAVVSAWIEFFGTRNRQKRLESRFPSGSPQCLVHETFGSIGQDIEDGCDLSFVGDCVVGSALIEFFGTRNEQKRLESQDPLGLPQRLVHETFGLIGQDN
jgi:hypothetical protein